jgi:histidinol-phosphate/aromatic aminotransferase/cobyric acid decarboxylase-like protein/choline kinase
MQGLILAAGMGKRLGKYTQDQTKCMVRVQGKTLIEYALDALNDAGITKVIIVIGYCGRKLQEFLGKKYKQIELIYVVNKNYNKTNNIFSLWLARNFLMQDDTLLLESDLIYEPKIIKDLLANKNANLAVVAKYESWMDGTVTLLDDAANIVEIIPKKHFEWAKSGSYYKTVNIYKFSQEFSRNYYLPFLEAYIKTMGKNEYYEQVLRVITFLEGIELKAHQLTSEKWYEIDDVQDLDIAAMLFADTQTELKLYQKRYGGYWRFPKLKDFCYLVNPYFPNRRMLDELKRNFDALIEQYPSGLNVQNLLAAKLVGCNSDEILVGNGAAELINGLVKHIPGKIGVIYPTFNEYPERIGAKRVKTMIPKNNEFRYSLTDIKKFADDLEGLILINPDNPSGNYFEKKPLLDLVEFCQDKDIFLIVDESFVDFVQSKLRFSLIDSEIFHKFSKLMVVKSISKSYGVPGLRLGVLASGNKDLLQRVRGELSIWNINSFGEYFLQIIGKYTADYEKACRLLGEERERFFQALSQISFLRTIPSQANYFLCEVTSQYTATQLSELLLAKYDILIKDCSGKTGFETGNFIRLAVRDAVDNDYLIAKLKEIDVINWKELKLKSQKLPN